MTTPIFKPVRCSVAAFALLSCLSGCDALLDCVDDDGPELEGRILHNPVLNQVYNETLRASIRNEPRDDNFRYRFVISGALPQGISTLSSGRDFIFSGTPTQLGRFEFTIHVEVDSRTTTVDSGLCFYSTSRDYALNVQMM